MNPLVLAPPALALLANSAIELLLIYDARKPFAQLSRAETLLRAARWLVVIAALLIPEFALATRVGLALFAVSAGQDLESRRVPPDAYLYAATAICVVLAGLTDGPTGALTAFAAQAICYGLCVLAVRYTGIFAGGDIKLAMQFGALCGTFSVLGNAAYLAGIAMAAAVLLTALLQLAQRRTLRTALQRAQTLRLPLGPFLWLGAFGALLLAARQI